MDITGRKLFVKALQEEGVDTIFGYPAACNDSRDYRYEYVAESFDKSFEPVLLLSHLSLDFVL